MSKKETEIFVKILKQGGREAVKLLENLGLNETQSKVLAVLISSRGSISAKSIQDSTGLPISSVYYAIRELEAMGLLLDTTSVYTLTEKGASLARSLQK